MKAGSRALDDRAEPHSRLAEMYPLMPPSFARRRRRHARLRRLLRTLVRLGIMTIAVFTALATLVLVLGLVWALLT